MTNVKVFWFGKTLLKSPRSGIRPNGAVVYDERIAKDLVNSYGDLIMVTSRDQRKILHFGKKIDPEYAAFKYPALQPLIEKAAGIKIVTTVSDVIKFITSEPLTLEDELQQKNLHAFLEAEDGAKTETSDPVTTDQEPTGAETKPEDTVVDKPKRGRPRKSAEDTPGTEIQ